MSREIKFRCWDHLSESFGEPVLAGNILAAIHGSGDELTESEQEQFVLQQYTGLKDSNSTDIYEGDIVRHCGKSDLCYKHPGPVSIGEYFTHAKEFRHFGVRAKRLDMEDSYFGLGADTDDFEVIGNIFENPELIKKYE